MLQKKSPKGLFKAWQDRYFKLYAMVIEYYKKPTDAAPAGHISILSVKVCISNSVASAQAEASRQARARSLTLFDLIS
jgi:hypothetical protein